MAKTVSVTADDLTPRKQRKETAMRQRGVVPSAELIPMQFRMPPDFAMKFRTEATKRGMKYNELLLCCFQHFMKTEAD